MTTKRLSEIGHERWAYEAWRELPNFDLTTQEKWGNPEKLVLLTNEERRELVREVKDALLQKVWEECNVTGDDLQPVYDWFEKFLKEQGL